MNAQQTEIIDILKNDWKLSETLAIGLSAQSIFARGLRKSKSLKAIGHISDNAPALLSITPEEKDKGYFETDAAAHAYVAHWLDHYAAQPDQKFNARDVKRFENRFCTDLRFKCAIMLDELFDGQFVV